LKDFGFEELPFLRFAPNAAFSFGPALIAKTKGEIFADHGGILAIFIKGSPCDTFNGFLISKGIFEGFPLKTILLKT
jgi:hypothetical protein